MRDVRHIMDLLTSGRSARPHVLVLNTIMIMTTTALTRGGLE